MLQETALEGMSPYIGNPLQKERQETGPGKSEQPVTRNLLLWETVLVERSYCSAGQSKLN